MSNNHSQAFSSLPPPPPPPPPPPVVTFMAVDFNEMPTSILVCISITMLFSLVYVMIGGFCTCFLDVRTEHDFDVEFGGYRRRRNHHHGGGGLYHHQQDNSWVIELLDRVMQAIEERRRIRQQVLEKILPHVSYRRRHNNNNNNNDDDDDDDDDDDSSHGCVICLEDFAEEELCRIFPECKHIFHLNCIDLWLKNHLTCPLCRSCIVDA